MSISTGSQTSPLLDFTYSWKTKIMPLLFVSYRPHRALTHHLHLFQEWILAYGLASLLSQTIMMFAMAVVWFSSRFGKKPPSFFGFCMGTNNRHLFLFLLGSIWSPGMHVPVFLQREAVTACGSSMTFLGYLDSSFHWTFSIDFLPWDPCSFWSHVSWHLNFLVGGDYCFSEKLDNFGLWTCLRYCFTH